MTLLASPLTWVKLDRYEASATATAAGRREQGEAMDETDWRETPAGKRFRLNDSAEKRRGHTLAWGVLLDDDQVDIRDPIKHEHHIYESLDAFREAFEIQPHEIMWTDWQDQLHYDPPAPPGPVY